MDHMSLFEDLNKAIKRRYEMVEAAVEAERQSQHMGRAIAERMDEMVEARAAEMTIEEAADVSATEAENMDVSDTPSEENEEDEWTWSESVLVGVMEKNGITDRDAFVEFAKSYDMDGNKYLKGSELGAAAGDFLAKMNGTDTEETATEPETTEVAEEPSAEETPEKEPEVTWRTSEDPWEGQ